MTYYQKCIIEITGASAEDAVQIEYLMRAQYHTLNHLSNAQFTKEALICYDAVKWMKTPEGQKYINEMEVQ